MIRGLALFQFLNLWPSIWLATSAVNFEAPLSVKISYYLVPVIYLVFSLFLWFLAPRIAGRMMRGASENTSKEVLPPYEDLFIVATVVTGLFILAGSFPGLVRLALTVSAWESGKPIQCGHIGLDSMLHIVLAALLIFKPSGLLGIISFTRRAGADK